jgi:hypothetical protein
MKKKRQILLDVAKKQCPSNKKIAIMNRWQKGWRTRRTRRMANAIAMEIVCTPNPLFADMRWVKA